MKQPFADQTTIKTLREGLLHIGPSAVGRRGASQLLGWNMCRGVSRMVAREEVAGIAGYWALVHRRDQQGAAGRKKPPERHSLAHKMRGEPQLFRR